MTISIVMPTYCRDRILTDTVGLLLALVRRADEFIIVDQTPRHDPGTESLLAAWDQKAAIRWMRRSVPSITGAMNDGLMAAKGDWVLFLDDDIIPSQTLIEVYASAVASHPDSWAVAGQVLQPGESPVEGIVQSTGGTLWQDLDFQFNRVTPGWVTNVMAGNLCVNREMAIAAGGYDENFGPPVAFRFETEFAKRLIGKGGKIWYEPGASIRHLRTLSGGTRSQGSHLASASPIHGVGDYYYALRCGGVWERLCYMGRRPFREIATQFHLRHPWWIPVKFTGELRAIAHAIRLYRNGPRLLQAPR